MGQLDLDRGSVKTQVWCWTVVLFVVMSRVIWADASTPLLIGSDVQAMGGAVSAVADDDLSLFYNPAGLAGAKRFKVRFLNLSVEASDDLLKSQSLVNPLLAGQVTTSSIDALMGKNIYARAQEVAVASFQGLAVAAIGDVQGLINLSNPNNPKGTLGIQSTYGGQVGYGDTILRLGKKKGELRFGVAVKYLMRSGGVASPTSTDILTLNTSKLYVNPKVTGSGVGLDLGTQFVYRINNKLAVMWGLAVADLGNTAFTNGISPQYSNVTTGFGFSYSGGDVAILLAYDYQRVFDNIDWQLKNKVGIKIKLPLIYLAAGFSEFYPSYGLGLDLGFLSAAYTRYTEEQSVVLGVNPEARNMITLRSDFSF